MRVCSIEGCNEKYFCKNMCRNHYARYIYKIKHPKKPERKCCFEGCQNKHYRSGYCSFHFSRLVGKYKRTRDEIQNRKCELEECERKHYAKGLCSKHYQEKTKKKERKKRGICSIEGCNNKHSAKGLCKKHYDSLMKDDTVRKAKITLYRQKYKQTENGKEQRRKAKEKRRAKEKNSVVIGNFTNKEIFLRDYFICSICGLPVDQTLTFPNRLSASLDHSVPLSKGGEHSAQNVTCTHLTCNVRRGNRPLKNNFDGASI